MAYELLITDPKLRAEIDEVVRALRIASHDHAKALKAYERANSAHDAAFAESLHQWCHSTDLPGVLRLLDEAKEASARMASARTFLAAEALSYHDLMKRAQALASKAVKRMVHDRQVTEDIAAESTFLEDMLGLDPGVLDPVREEIAALRDGADDE